MKSQVPGAGETHQPVSHQSQDHGHTGLLETPECPGRVGLDAIEDLKDGRQGQENGSIFDHAEVGRVVHIEKKRQNPTRSEPEDEGAARHEAGAQSHPRVTGTASGPGVCPPDGLAHPTDTAKERPRGIMYTIPAQLRTI